MNISEVYDEGLIFLETLFFPIEAFLFLTITDFITRGLLATLLSQAPYCSVSPDDVTDVARDNAAWEGSLFAFILIL